MNRSLSKHRPLSAAEERFAAAHPDPQILDALAGLDANANLAVVQRTRRAVMEAAQHIRTGQTRHRRQLGVILLAVGALIMLLTPAIWVVADDLFGEEHFLDLPAMTMSVLVTLFSAIFAALIYHWRSQQSRDGERF